MRTISEFKENVLIEFPELAQPLENYVGSTRKLYGVRLELFGN